MCRCGRKAVGKVGGTQFGACAHVFEPSCNSFDAIVFGLVGERGDVYGSVAYTVGGVVEGDQVVLEGGVRHGAGMVGEEVVQCGVGNEGFIKLIR